MPDARTTIIDLSRLALSHGEGRRLDMPVELEPFQLGGLTYLANPFAPTVRLEVSRPAGGFAFHLTFPVHLEGPCMRCLEEAALDLEVEAREIDQSNTDDPELHSPYVTDDELDIGRWAHDATMLALPARFLCRPDCAGLCPICGKPLYDADPAAHEHETPTDPRWSALKNLKLD
ncbi:MAG TPA: YceD family protein [Solirubrobacterales bacterium]